MIDNTHGRNGRSQGMAFHVRPMTGADVHRCALVEREALPTLFPPTSFGRELGNRLAKYLVAESAVQGRQSAGTAGTGAAGGMAGLDDVRGRAAPGGAVGFIGIWYMAEQAHVAGLGVLPTKQGRGIGELLLIAAIEHAVMRRSKVMTLEVRESNYIARNLYRKYGFTDRGRRRGYYSDNREDAVIMTTDRLGGRAFGDSLERLVAAHVRSWGESVRRLA